MPYTNVVSRLKEKAGWVVSRNPIHEKLRPEEVKTLSQKGAGGDDLLSWLWRLGVQYRLASKFPFLLPLPPNYQDGRHMSPH